MNTENALIVAEWKGDTNSLHFILYRTPFGDYVYYSYEAANGVLTSYVRKTKNEALECYLCLERFCDYGYRDGIRNRYVFCGEMPEDLAEIAKANALWLKIATPSAGGEAGRSWLATTTTNIRKPAFTAHEPEPCAVSGTQMQPKRTTLRG